MIWALIVSNIVGMVGAYLFGRKHQNALNATDNLELWSSYERLLQTLDKAKTERLRQLRDEQKEFDALPWNEKMKKLGLK